MKSMEVAPRRGVALILVLAFVVLVSGILVAFLTTAGNSRRSAAQYESGVSLTQLAETATNVIMGQIVDGTRSWKVSNGSDTSPGSRLTYSTQPGLIRSYDSAGRVDRAYKLYSSDTMVTAPGTEWVVKNELGREVPADWVKKSAQFVDLNQPVLVSDASGSVQINGQRFTANYPILDPSALSPTGRYAVANTPQDGVEGFDLLNVPGYGGPGNGGRPKVNANYDPTSVPAAGQTSNPAPMPVRWLYVLQNGTITSPDPASSTDTVARWANLRDGNPNKPSKANPIVGRIAFWTDDDTCKLNPNVHSEGVAWSPGMRKSSNAASPYAEDQLVDRAPMRGEYQRYPGHPATVCLSPIFGMIPSYRPPTSDIVTTEDYNGSLSRYFDLSPRVGKGGSKGGTESVTSASSMSFECKRLYVSPDELMFTPDRAGTPAIKRSDLERSKFFLTTQGRAAEVNLFNQPRVSLWMPHLEKDPNYGKPGWTFPDTGARNAKDKLLAFCATVNGSPYMFQRMSAYLTSPPNNRGAHLTVPSGQLPTYGYTAPSSQQSWLDWNVPRNLELYSYLQTLTVSPIPGFGGKLSDPSVSPTPFNGPPYGTEQRNQILTEMVDFLRLNNGYSADMPMYYYAPARDYSPSGISQVVPLVTHPMDPKAPTDPKVTSTKGIGRFPTITEAMLVFYMSSAGKMRALLALELYTPTAGSWSWSPLVRFVAKGMDKVKVNGQTGVFRQTLTNLVTSRAGFLGLTNPTDVNGVTEYETHRTAFTGAFASFRYWRAGGGSVDNTKRIPPSGTKAFDEEKDYPFVSDEMPLVGDKSGMFKFSGDFSIEIHTGYAESASPETLVQTLNFSFPDVSVPLPRDSGADKDYNNRLGDNRFNLVNAADTVRSVEVDPTGPSRGDLRLVAALQNVPSNYFRGYEGGADGPGYNSNTATIVHSFRHGQRSTIVGGQFQSSLIPAGAKGYNIAARGMNGATMASNVPGDWENCGRLAGWLFEDGAYINKPDDSPSIGLGYGGGWTGYNGYDSPTNTPNRQISSPVIFGSLPVSSPNNAQPWRTLLFCPNPAAGNAHPSLSGTFAPGAARVRDHLFLDFFTVPIVEPFAISEPLSTMGKVNLNFQIAPFSYIRRSTALNGVLKGTRICAIQSAIPTGAGAATGEMDRFAIDPDETVRGFQDRFDNPSKGGAFRSASEICDMYLVPKGVSLAGASAWWNKYPYTGDNSREEPYSQIYARVTTKSNTFTVHARVQMLRKHPDSDWSEWREGVDHVMGEQRSSQTIERYVDLSDKSLPDFAKFPNETLDRFYKFRVVQTKRFNPQ